MPQPQPAFDTDRLTEARGRSVGVEEFQICTPKGQANGHFFWWLVEAGRTNIFPQAKYCLLTEPILLFLYIKVVAGKKLGRKQHFLGEGKTVASTPFTGWGCDIFTQSIPLPSQVNAASPLHLLQALDLVHGLDPDHEGIGHCPSSLLNKKVEQHGSYISSSNTPLATFPKGHSGRNTNGFNLFSPKHCRNCDFGRWVQPFSLCSSSQRP